MKSLSKRDCRGSLTLKSEVSPSPRSPEAGRVGEQLIIREGGHTEKPRSHRKGGAGFSGNLVIRDCKGHLHLMSVQGCQNERDLGLNLGKISSSLSGYQITGNPAHINREAKEKERRKKEGGREGGRTEDEEQRMREFGSGHISCLPHSSLPPSPTDRTRTTDNNHHHSSTQCRGRAQDLGEHEERKYLAKIRRHFTLSGDSFFLRYAYGDTESETSILGPKLLLVMGCVKLGEKNCVHLPSVGEQTAN